MIVTKRMCVWCNVEKELWEFTAEYSYICKECEATPPTEKICPECKETKALSFFGISRSRQSGQAKNCKVCIAYMEYVKKHPDITREKYERDLYHEAPVAVKRSNGMKKYMAEILFSTAGARINEIEKGDKELFEEQKGTAKEIENVKTALDILRLLCKASSTISVLEEHLGTLEKKSVEIWGILGAFSSESCALEDAQRALAADFDLE